MADANGINVDRRRGTGAIPLVCLQRYGLRAGVTVGPPVKADPEGDSDRDASLRNLCGTFRSEGTTDGLLLINHRRLDY